VEALDAVIAEWMGARTRPEVLAVMEREEVAVGPIYDVASVYADPHFQERGSFVEVQDPDLGPMHMVGVVPRLSATPGRVRTTGPKLGQHTEEVFAELGVDADELDRLRGEGVV
jgi:crotonobetainyl-CoA:carnitine CoA-transferase CaiB-like acyl-CoA transferase